MNRGQGIFTFLLFLLALALAYSPLQAGDPEGDGSKTAAEAVAAPEAEPVFAAMPKPGKKVPIGNGGYLIYGFDKKPRLGPVILKVEVHTPDGNRDTSVEVLVDSGMPSMRGAHETGDRPCKLSRKGDYLLPVDIVMPGDWEIRLTVKKDGQVVFRGSHGFDV